MKRSRRSALIVISVLLVLSVGISTVMFTANASAGYAAIYGKSSDGAQLNIGADAGIYDEGERTMESVSEEYELLSDDTATKRIAMPSIFANGMVFQRGKTINVFGFCDDHDAVFKVTLGDREGTATVDESGRFYVEIGRAHV